MNTINWGILGASNFALNLMAPAIHSAAGARLHMLATSSPEKAAKFQTFCPDIEVKDSYDALLADPTVDAVYIPLPNHIHVEWTLKALAAGKPVLCEKPIAMKAGEFDQLIAARDASGLLAAEAYMIVHHPQWHLAREIVRSGEIGELLHVSGLFTYNNAADAQNIRNRAETGGGSIPDIGVYTFGSARYVTGEEPEEIRLADLTWEDGVDVTARVAARFPSFSFTSLTSMRMERFQEMVFQGSKGALRMPFPFNPAVNGEATVIVHSGTNEKVYRFPTVNHYVNQVEAFGRAVQDGGGYPCPLEFSRGTQEMIDRVFEKAKQDIYQG